jgi:hypothetical protein
LKGAELVVHRCENCVEIQGDYIKNSKVVSPQKVGQAGKV